MLRDVAPGEAIFVDQAGRLPRAAVRRRTRRSTPCIFEFVYLARPDSVIDGASVYESRLHMGGELAREDPRHARGAGHRRRDPDSRLEPPVRARAREPRSACTYREGFVKNRYIGRTFIMPGQAMRKKSGAPEAQPDRHGVQGQGRAAGRRLDRARHDVARDRADGARRRRAQGVLRVRQPAGALSRTCTASTCRTRTSSSRPAAPRRRSRARSAPTSSIYQDLEALKNAVRAVEPAPLRVRGVVLRRQVHHRRHHRRDYLSHLAAHRDERRDTEDLLEEAKLEVASGEPADG